MRQRGAGYARSEAESYGYASEMNPKLKGKKVPMLEERCEEEFCAAPFNHEAAEVRTLILKGTRPHCRTVAVTINTLKTPAGRAAR